MFLSQLITLSLNTRLSSALNDISFESGKYYLVTRGVTSSCGASSITLGSDLCFELKKPVVDYVISKYGGKISGLLALANDMIAKKVAATSTLTIADVSFTVDAINRAFDQGRAFVKFDGTCGTTVKGINTQAVTQLPVVDEVPTTISVSAYPNPYSGNIRFTVANPKAGRGSLEVYNLLGQKVSTVYRGFIPAGTQTYNLNLSPLQRTNLIYRLSVGDKQVTGKLLHAGE